MKEHACGDDVGFLSIFKKCLIDSQINFNEYT